MMQDSGAAHLWQTAETQTEKVLASGDMIPVVTDPVSSTEYSYPGRLWMLSKSGIKQKRAVPACHNPFLPYEKSMFVSDVGSEHVCLLNKFPVLRPHLLICSNAFVDQRSPLTKADFQAWWAGILDSSVMGFYNSGPEAGASQAHRHMQLVRSENWFAREYDEKKIPFLHWSYDFEGEEVDADFLFELYLSAMSALSLNAGAFCLPYNLLLHHNKMIIVPRSRSSFHSISCNGMNYMGHFLLRNQEQLQLLCRIGPLELLKECAVPI